MHTHSRGLLRTTWVSVRAMILLTLVLGIGYPVLVTGIGQLVAPSRANGSIITDSAGHPVGSVLIGQSWSDADGQPLAQYFQPRPSAIGYDATVSGSSNLGPDNSTLAETIAERRARVAAFNAVSVDSVPPDAVTASASGIDPDISPAYAAIQVARVAQARGIAEQSVRDLVEAHTQRPVAGFLGESTVNVLELNLALDESRG